MWSIEISFRLNHPVRTVRNRISELLCRIAEEHPQLVIYPAVVGSMSGVASSDTFSKLLSTNIVDEEKLTNGNGNGEEEDKSPEMQSAHAKIVDAIAKKSSSASESIEHVSQNFFTWKLLFAVKYRIRLTSMTSYVWM